MRVLCVAEWPELPREISWPIWLAHPPTTYQDAQLLIRQTRQNFSTKKWWAWALLFSTHQMKVGHIRLRTQKQKELFFQALGGKALLGGWGGLRQRHHRGFICDSCWLVLGFSGEEVEWKENRGLPAHNYPSEQGHLSGTHSGFPRFLGLPVSSTPCL